MVLVKLGKWDEFVWNSTSLANVSFSFKPKAFKSLIGECTSYHGWYSLDVCYLQIPCLNVIPNLGGRAWWEGFVSWGVSWMAWCPSCSNEFMWELVVWKSLAPISLSLFLFLLLCDILAPLVPSAMIVSFLRPHQKPSRCWHHACIARSTTSQIISFLYYLPSLRSSCTAMQTD